MENETVSGRLAELRRDHTELRAALLRHAGALDDLELRGDRRAMAALLAALNAECSDRFPLEEQLARELLGEGSGSLASLQAEHRDLRQRVAQVERLMAGADMGESLDALWRAWVELARAVSCHVCREEHTWLPMLELSAGGATPPALVPRPPCQR
jgi:hypothetical protein